MPRLTLFCALLLALGGCARPEAIQKDALLEKTKSWKEPKVAIWYYTGSKDGRDYFLYHDLGVEKSYSVTSGEIKLSQTFPTAEDPVQWVVMPWGPASRQSFRKYAGQLTMAARKESKGAVSERQYCDIATALFKYLENDIQSTDRLFAWIRNPSETPNKDRVVVAAGYDYGIGFRAYAFSFDRQTGFLESVTVIPSE